MNIILKVGFCCVALIACGRVASAQAAGSSDPCGNSAAESSFWGAVRGKVVKVEDGDTFFISVKGRGASRVSLVGVDAPERGEPFGEPARRLLETMLNGKDVEVWVKAEVGMSRRVPAELAGVVHLRDMGMLDVNLLLIQAGLARHKKSEPYSMSNHVECHYMRAEEDARIARRGLWRGAA